MAVEAFAYRRTVGRRATASMKAKNENETKQNKYNTKDNMERKRKKRLEDTRSRHLWLINYGDRTSTNALGLGYPVLGYILGMYLLRFCLRVVSCHLLQQGIMHQPCVWHCGASSRKRQRRRQGSGWRQSWRGGRRRMTAWRKEEEDVANGTRKVVVAQGNVKPPKRHRLALG